MRTIKNVTGLAAKLRASLVVGIAVAGTVLATQTPAAATWTECHGLDCARTEYANEDRLTACDGESDDNGVYGRFGMSSGVGYIDISDPDGNGGVCGFQDWSASPYWCYEFQIVERNVGASAWQSTDGLGGS